MDPRITAAIERADIEWCDDPEYGCAGWRPTFVISDDRDRAVALYEGLAGANVQWAGSNLRA